MRILMMWAAAALAAGVGQAGEHAAEKIQSESVRRLQVDKVNGQYILRADVTFRNLAGSEVKFRKPDLTVCLDVKAGKRVQRTATGLEIEGGGSTQKVVQVTETATERIELGKLVAQELVFPDPDSPAKRLEKRLEVVMGAENDPVVAERARRIFNLVQDPTEPYVLLLEGQVRPGTPTASGYYYPPLPVELEMKFTPAGMPAILLQPGG
jgi:hypothetical protein